MARICRMGGLGMRRKGLEDLNVYRNQKEQDDKVRRTLIGNGCCGACEGQALALRPPRCVFFRCIARDRPSHYGYRGAFFRRAGACPPRSLPHLGHPDNPGHPASDARAIKVLTDLFCLLRRRAIDIKVFQTFSPYACCVSMSEAGFAGFAGWPG